VLPKEIIILFSCIYIYNVLQSYSPLPNYLSFSPHLAGFLHKQFLFYNHAILLKNYSEKEIKNSSSCQKDQWHKKIKNLQRSWTWSPGQSYSSVQRGGLIYTHKDLKAGWKYP
jgi:hypothetical protein